MLHRPGVAPLVVVFWGVTTGWLLVTKVLPTFHGGTAPNVATLAAADAPLMPVGWTVHWNGAPIGWALSASRRTADGGMVVDNRLHCDRLPVDEILPAWMGSMLPRSRRPGEAIEFEALGRVDFNPTGALESFSSRVVLPDGSGQVVVEGRVVAPGEVQVSFRAGELRYETSRRVPDHVLIGDELSPQATLPGLTPGRRWTVPVYSPLRPGNAPLQILHAEVGGEETIFWGDRLVNARIVTYREDPTSPREPRCRLWVDRAGRVLRHESLLLGARMEFVRRTDAETERLSHLAAALDATDAPPREDAP